MRSHIDRFSKLGGAIIVHGWSDAYIPGHPVSLFQGDELLETITRAIPRPDLPQFYGEGAERWGFRAYGVASGDIATPYVGLRFGNGETIHPVQTASAPPSNAAGHLLWARFQQEMNERGGTLLEIGARARSGSSQRDNFGPSITYIGADITDGPNVDIVCDAHHLSDHIADKVDYICSISTFEHFILPWKVAIEANRILKPGGRIFTSSHQTWPVHDAPFDYFRFSDQAWHGLFNIHTGFRIVAAAQGEPVSAIALYNSGGPFEEMEHSPGFAHSVCIAEKIGEPMVEWNAPASLIRQIEYTY